MRLRSGAIALLMMSLTGPVLADAVLPIGGAFGNAAGCTLFMTGEVLRDDLLILTPDTFSTSATVCAFETLVSKSSDGFAVNASCSGDAADGSGRLAVRGDRHNGYFVSTGEAATEWGPLRECPGTAKFFTPPGMQI